MKCHCVIIIELKQKDGQRERKRHLIRAVSVVVTLIYFHTICLLLGNFPGVDFKGQKKRRKIVVLCSRPP